MLAHVAYAQDVIGINQVITEKRSDIPRSQNGVSLGMTMDDFIAQFPNSVEQHKILNILLGRRIFEVAKFKLPREVELMRVLFYDRAARSIGVRYAPDFAEANPWEEFVSKLVAIYGMPIQRNNQVVAWKDRECFMALMVDRGKTPGIYYLVIQFKHEEHEQPAEF